MYQKLLFITLLNLCKLNLVMLARQVHAGHAYVRGCTFIYLIMHDQVYESTTSCMVMTGMSLQSYNSS
jgi:hypothetical protein